MEAKSRIDTWRTITPRRRAHSATEIHKPVVIHARSRIDTWRKPTQTTSSNFNRILHRPIQVEGRSRIDTWQTQPSLQQIRTATEVQALVFKTLCIVDLFFLDS